MELKLAYASLLSIVALFADAQTTTTVAPASTGADSSSSSFMPPASATCLASNIMTGGDFLDCCPSADPDDGICTIIWCINRDAASGESLIRDSCDCGMVETACEQLSSFSGMVPGLAEACAEMGDCCEAGATANSDFATCTEEALTALNLTLPDYNSLVPGGVPDLDEITSTATTTAAATTVAAETTTAGAGDRTTVSPEVAATTTAAAATTVAEATDATTTVAAETEATTTVTAETEATTTVAAATTTAAPKEVTTGTSGASAYAINVAFSFVVASLAMQPFM